MMIVKLMAKMKVVMYGNQGGKMDEDRVCGGCAFFVELRPGAKPKYAGWCRFLSDKSQTHYIKKSDKNIDCFANSKRWQPREAKNGDMEVKGAS